MKKLILITSLIAITLSSCLKDSPTTVNFTNAGNIVNFPLSGTPNFGSDALTGSIDTIQFAVDYATATPNKALSVTLAVDQTLTTAYNTATSATTGVTYEPMPTSVYSLSTTTVNIAAGAQYAFVTLIVQQNQLDPTKSYMLPIKIASANGVPISANQSVHYFHIIGNAIAGPYTYNYTRYNNGVGPSVGGVLPPVNEGTVTLVPDNANQVEVASAYVGIRYVITFDQSGTTLSNFAVSQNASDVSSALTNSGVSIVQPPKIITADPVNGVYEFYYIAKNSAGSLRYIDDKYSK
ncbi:uncharacterized protein DUF1735 [Mucilaginibacter frigoritolerans]|uniref:Uncharacterized protein DUF1735 n=1 Tax=Mucilaginibacter frigoritolerans TaxID=652788 RepID=A0A562UCK6_9SPHI|nr:DUF1735 domain-containing protein [Mucilaginibacter frigoritolerans]TWJ03584.1 uncharacterized protein DUF1735 [Mucilaginibacter frigoritolerans]